MNLLANLFLYLMIAVLIFQNQLALAALAIFIFTWRCGAIWLLPLGILIDGYFGAFYEVPVISIAFAIWYLVTEIVRPRLLIKVGL